MITTTALTCNRGSTSGIGQTTRPTGRVTRRSGLAAVLSSAVALWAATAEARKVSSVNMPEVVTIAGRELHLNGMGLRKEKGFFKVYVVGLYLERPTRDPRAAMTNDEAKRIVLVMLRDVDRDVFVESMETGIQRNSGPQMPALRTRLDRLKRAIPDIKKGNVLDFTYVPGVGTLVRGQGEEMAIEGKDFADALFAAWLGSIPIDRDLKRKLLDVGHVSSANQRRSGSTSVSFAGHCARVVAPPGASQPQVTSTISRPRCLLRM